MTSDKRKASVHLFGFPIVSRADWPKNEARLIDPLTGESLCRIIGLEEGEKK
jgi:hypothetical protein